MQEMQNYQQNLSATSAFFYGGADEKFYFMGGWKEPVSGFDC